MKLGFLSDAAVFRQRFLLAEVLGPPRAVEPHGGRRRVPTSRAGGAAAESRGDRGPEAVPKKAP